ncbi:MAG: aminotransferase class IV [Planctomycetales bacterium]|nr:aminotransferase class IV [Planctomycetales bacterium]
MAQPVAYLNGQWISAAEAAVSVNDLGFLLGATVAERLRTFGGKLFRLEQHLQRLERSLAIVGISLHQSMDDLGEVATELARRNHALLAAGDDLNLSLFVTPGIAGANSPTVGMHTAPLPFGTWADEYDQGVPLVVSSVRHLPPDCLPPELKCRSRMHYHLADQEARRKDPSARALLLDIHGVVTEASTANLLLWRRGEGFIAPRRGAVLPGVSLAFVRELADRLGEPWAEADLAPSDVASADEAVLTSTPFALLPVSHVDGAPIGKGAPGATYRRLLDAWGDAVGVKIDEQSRRFAAR